MGQSLSQLYVHLTFGTKNRFPFIKPEIEDRLHPYIAAIFKSLDSPTLSINSVPDHIHILFRLSKNYALAKVVEEVTWQIGYGAFSVSGGMVDTVKNYIGKQKEHHAKRTYMEEVEEFIREYGVIEYEAKYFWG